jgi:hypothetical protein
VLTTDETSSASFINTYDPSRGKKSQVTKEQWVTAQVPVRQMMAPFRKQRTLALRPLMATAARFAAWAQPRGYELFLKSLPRPSLIEDFLARQPFWRSRCRALSLATGAWKTVPKGATRRTKVARVDYRAPYFVVEMSGLLRGARAQVRASSGLTLPAPSTSTTTCSHGGGDPCTIW